MKLPQHDLQCETIHLERHPLSIIKLGTVGDFIPSQLKEDTKRFMSSLIWDVSQRRTLLFACSQFDLSIEEDGDEVTVLVDSSRSLGEVSDIRAKAIASSIARFTGGEVDLVITKERVGLLGTRQPIRIVV